MLTISSSLAPYGSNIYLNQNRPTTYKETPLSLEENLKQDLNDDAATYRPFRNKRKAVLEEANHTVNETVLFIAKYCSTTDAQR